MPRSAASLIPAILVLLALPAAAADSKGTWTKLVAKQDASGEITGWRWFCETPGTKTGDVWRLTDEGVLVCRGEPKGYLATEREYGEFALRLQWRWPEGKAGKGGVLIRMTGPDKIWPTSLEAQLNYPDAGDFWGLDGYTFSGPSQRLKRIDESPYGKLVNLRREEDFEKPVGQWNTYEIVAAGGTVILRINDHEVNRAVDCVGRAGRICLTSEGNEIHFRRIELLAKKAR